MPDFTMLCFLKILKHDFLETSLWKLKTFELFPLGPMPHLKSSTLDRLLKFLAGPVAPYFFIMLCIWELMIERF